jgi:hypothetical protein
MLTIVTDTVADALMAVGAAFILYWFLRLIMAITVVIKWK